MIGGSRRLSSTMILISKIRADAIVNAVQSDLKVMSRMNMAIFVRAGVNGLEKELGSVLGERDTPSPVPVGQVIVTRGLKLPARFIVHVVAPSWTEKDAEALLRSCYDQCWLTMQKNGWKTMAVPCISAGNQGGFPIARAVSIALQSLKQWIDGEGHDYFRNAVQRIVFVVFSARNQAVFEHVLRFTFRQ